MSGEIGTISYATGEAAQVGDRIDADGWDGTVEDVVASAERLQYWGLSEQGLMVHTAAAGLVFYPATATDWNAIVLLGRAQ